MRQKKRIKVLVYPCGSEIGLEIHQALQYSTHIELYGADSAVSNHGKYVYEHYIASIPHTSNPLFFKKLHTIVQEYGIDCIFPAGDDVGLFLSEHHNEIACKILSSPLKTMRICRSKSETYRVMNNRISLPRQYPKKAILSKKDFPVFLKPDKGSNSKGTYHANNQQELHTFLQRDPSLLVLEYLPGKEYTVDCFTDRNGNLLFVGGRERVRIKNGISVDTIPVQNEQFKIIAKMIHKTLIFQGAWFFQVRENIRGELSLLEVAPRVAGSMGMYRCLGVNFPLLTVLDAYHHPVSICPNTFHIEMDRALINRYTCDISYKHLYIDLDDTLVFRRKKINLSLIMLVYQSLQTGKYVHVLTRHKGEIEKTLKALKLANLFHSIIFVKRGMLKSEYIKHRSAIFIDDSYGERYDVFTKKHIPVFDTAAVEALLYWKT